MNESLLGESFMGKKKNMEELLDRSNTNLDDSTYSYYGLPG